MYTESGRKIFSNKDTLNPDFVPKLLPFRENHQKLIAENTQFFFDEGIARNIFCYGATGTGKTHAVKRVLEDLFEQEGIQSIQMNCWGKTSNEIIFLVSKKLLGATTTKEAELLIQKIRLHNPKKVLFFDDADMAKDSDYLYMLLNSGLRFLFILTAASKKFLAQLDDRTKSRFMPLEIEFKEYTESQILEILRERKKYAFFENTWETRALKLLAEKVFEKQDLRFGLKVMALAGQKAESKKQRMVSISHVKSVLNSFKVQN